VSNTGGGKVGLVGYWDVVCLDEFEQVVGSKRSDGDMVNIMQNYMANKSFNRGKQTIQAYASMAFVGNTKHSVPQMLRSSHLFESIPQAYIKGAFLDRIHIYIPGWEVKILKDSMLTREYGFIVDYMAEILQQLRKFDYSNLIDTYVAFDTSFSGRDKTAVRKTFSGLVKLIYPDLKMTEQEALELIHFATEGRKRVKDQLYVIDETFRSSPVDFQYTLKTSSRTVEVETLENLNYGAQKKQLPQENEEEECSPENTPETKIPVPALKEKEIILQDNQTGVTYTKLFGEYLKGATEIVLTDPYIRMIHQFKNLLEFCRMLAEIRDGEDEIHLHIVTWNDLEHTPQSIDNFVEMQDSLAELGINLTWEFLDLHDRHIVANNGWKIKLGRGLDIYEKTSGRFDIAEIMQEKRQCRNCEITFLKNS
jgi:ATP-dependent Lon protease